MGKAGVPAVPARLLELAPRELPRPRARRYRGEGFHVDLAAFAEADRQKLADIYARCESVYRAWLQERDGTEIPEVEDRLAAFRDPAFVSEADTLGHDTMAGSPPDEVLRVLHDVRGGGLAALVGLAEILPDRPDRGLRRDAVLLARDHAKMMRQAILDLDPDRRAEDEAEKVHGVDDVARKWARGRYHAGGRTVEVRVDARYRDGLASRCLEAAAVDRVLYNMINNAARFAEDRRVALDIFRMGDDIRFVVTNALAAADRAWLEEQTAGDAGVLFRPGVSRGGQGLGLSNCARIIATAYGLDGPAGAVAGGHLGASIRGGRFHAWFHWPTYG